MMNNEELRAKAMKEWDTKREVEAFEEGYHFGVPKWNDVSVEPEFTDEYNVVYDLEDGEGLVTTTMEYDKNGKVWRDVIAGYEHICHTVKLWMPIPGVPEDVQADFMKTLNNLKETGYE